MIFDRHANLKYKYGEQEFLVPWILCGSGRENAKMIQEYIQNQLEEDLVSD